MSSFALAGKDCVLRTIRRDQVATFSVCGGFARLPAPEDGLLLESTTDTILLRKSDLKRALLEGPVQADRVALRRVLPGELLGSDGGLPRKPAAVAGLEIATKERTFLVPEKVLKMAVQELDRGGGPRR